MEWTDEAAEAACSLLFNLWEHRVQKSHMVSALNAAAEYEGVFPTSYVTETQRDAYLRGRAEALEEAAKVCEQGVNNATDWDSSYWDQACLNRAAAILALKTGE